MLRCVAETTVAEEGIVAAQDDLESAAPMELSHRICRTGEAVVDLGGELDILSAEVAVSYVTDVIDRHRGPVTANLAALAFCDARGLAALVRMAGYAEQKGCPFRLASPSGSLVKIMRITGLDRRFLAAPCSLDGSGFGDFGPAGPGSLAPGEPRPRRLPKDRWIRLCLPKTHGSGNAIVTSIGDR